MRTLPLNGEWRFQRADGAYTGTGNVPGCVHTDLLAEGHIGDTFYRDNEDHLHWIGESTWVYEREFEADAQLAAHPRLFLICEGLDTLATIELNGRTLAETDNMFHPWRLDIGGQVREGSNTLRITFADTFGRIRGMSREKRLASSGEGSFRRWGGHYIRKNQSNYGWDWGPVCVTAGIWRDIRIEAPDTARIADFTVRQPEVDADQACLEIDVDSEIFAEEAVPAVKATLSLDGTTVAEMEGAPSANGHARLHAVIARPALWWTNGMGPQPLYDLEISLMARDGRTLDTRTHRVGIRKLELVREKDAYGESFRFRINDRDIFAKGANWIPADVFPSRLRRDDYRHLLESARDACHNMVRIWGGGIYEDTAFYECCDELGILVWQDFMYACAAYPVDDPAWLTNVENETAHAVKRLRNHTCLALWCGNNELEMMAKRMLDPDGDPPGMRPEDYKQLFHNRIPAIVAEHDPETPYWPSSHHNPDPETWGASENAGDRHFWGVWWGLMKFEAYREIRTRFCSEFGFQSFPHPLTIGSCTAPEDRNLVSYVMDRHQKANTRIGSGNATILAYTSNLFQLPDHFADQVIVSQIAQAMAIKTGVEHWRRDQPRCGGALYWQLNDCWPGQSWSSIDYAGRWKALHYEARRFFSPVLISAVEDTTNGTLKIFLTNETPENRELNWSAQAIDTAGGPLEDFGGSVDVPAGTVVEAVELDLADLIARQTPRNLLVCLNAEANGEVLSRNLAHFAPPKHWALHDPGLEVSVSSEPGDRGFACTITAPAAPAFYLHLGPEIDAHADDAFFHLPKGGSRTIRVRPRGGTASVNAETLQTGIRSLHDLVPTA